MKDVLAVPPRPNQHDRFVIAAFFHRFARPGTNTEQLHLLRPSLQRLPGEHGHLYRGIGGRLGVRVGLGIELAVNTAGERSSAHFSGARVAVAIP